MLLLYNIIEFPDLLSHSKSVSDSALYCWFLYVYSTLHQFLQFLLPQFIVQYFIKSTSSLVSTVCHPMGFIGLNIEQNTDFNIHRLRKCRRLFFFHTRIVHLSRISYCRISYIHISSNEKEKIEWDTLKAVWCQPQNIAIDYYQSNPWKIPLFSFHWSGKTLKKCWEKKMPTFLMKNERMNLIISSVQVLLIQQFHGTKSTRNLFWECIIICRLSCERKKCNVIPVFSSLCCFFFFWLLSWLIGWCCMNGKRFSNRFLKPH